MKDHGDLARNLKAFAGKDDKRSRLCVKIMMMYHWRTLFHLLKAGDEAVVKSHCRSDLNAGRALRILGGFHVARRRLFAEETNATQPA